MIADIQAYTQALTLRRAGKSYSEIGKELGVAKSTLSCWFSGMEWSQEVTEKLNMRWGEVSRQKILLMNSERNKKTQEKYLSIKAKAQEEFEVLVQNPLFVAGLSLYWGEGTKTEDGKVAVINSEASMLQIVMRFYREILCIKDSKIRAAIFIYADQDDTAMKLYWSEKLQIPLEKFIKTQVLPSRSTHTKRKVPVGMCSIYFSSVEMSIKIREWLRLLAVHMRE